MLGHGALGETALGAGTFQKVLQENLSTRGLSRVLSENSPYSYRDLKGWTFDEAGLAIARSRPIRRRTRRGRSGRVKAAKKVGRATRPSQPPYWSRVKRELNILICTGDPKYKDLRAQISTRAKSSQMTVVSTIAAGVAAYAGVVAGAVVPLAALCLIGMLKVGKEAYCSQFQNLKV